MPTSGEILIDGQSTTALDDDALTLVRRDRIGTVFQFFNLLPALTVEQNVALPLVLQRIERGDTAARVAEALTLVGMTGRAGAFPAELSGGQQQRVAIARAIVHRPTILLADEPTGNLDSRSGGAVLDLLREVANRGQTVLMATHNMEAAARCDRTLSMQDGKWVYSYAG